MKKIREDWDRNRTMKLKPHRTKIWCGGCDANMVQPGKKCEYCKGREPSKKLRK